MEYLYVIVSDGCEWEDIQICDTKEIAVEYSSKYMNIRIEIFKKNEKGMYVPTYTYYKRGQLVNE